MCETLVLHKLTGSCGPCSADGLDFSFFRHSRVLCLINKLWRGPARRTTCKFMSSLTAIEMAIVGPHPLATQLQSYSMAESLVA